MTVAMLLTTCAIVSNATEANTSNQVTNASEQNVINADDNKTEKCVEFVAGTDNGTTGILEVVLFQTKSARTELQYIAHVHHSRTIPTASTARAQQPFQLRKATS